MGTRRRYNREFSVEWVRLLAVIRWLLLVSAAAPCFAPACLAAQAITGEVAGAVRDLDGRPVGGVLVRISDVVPSLDAITDTNGQFVIDRVPVGNHILHLRRIGAAPATSAPFQVASNQQTRLRPLLMRLGPPRGVWLGCSATERGGSDRAVCDAGKFVSAPHALPHGIGLVRDAETWNRLWRRFGDTAEWREAQHVDWDHSMIVIISYGSTGYIANLRNRLNRVLEWPDSTLVELGPDSLDLGSYGEIESMIVPVDAWIVRRSSARVIVRRILGGSTPDWTAAWDGKARQ
jgi:Carboxypeptidase regulatory-like domain